MYNISWFLPFGNSNKNVFSKNDCTPRRSSRIKKISQRYDYVTGWNASNLSPQNNENKLCCSKGDYVFIGWSAGNLSPMIN